MYIHTYLHKQSLVTAVFICSADAYLRTYTWIPKCVDVCVCIYAILGLLHYDYTLMFTNIITTCMGVFVENLLRQSYLWWESITFYAKILAALPVTWRSIGKLLLICCASLAKETQHKNVDCALRWRRNWKWNL